MQKYIRVEFSSIKNILLKQLLKAFSKIRSAINPHEDLFTSWFCCSGRIPRLSLNQHSLYVGEVEKPPPPPLTGTERWSRNTLRVVTARVFYVLGGVFNVPLYFK